MSFKIVFSTIMITFAAMPVWANCSSVIKDAYGKHYTATVVGGSEANYKVAYSKAIEACVTDSNVLQSVAKCMDQYVTVIGYSGESCNLPQKYTPEPAG